MDLKISNKMRFQCTTKQRIQSTNRPQKRLSFDKNVIFINILGQLS